MVAESKIAPAEVTSLGGCGVGITKLAVIHLGNKRIHFGAFSKVPSTKEQLENQPTLPYYWLLWDFAIIYAYFK